jgi:hypothetical protein
LKFVVNMRSPNKLAVNNKQNMIYKLKTILKRLGRYTPQEGDRVICLYPGNGKYGLEATVETVAIACERLWIRFDDGELIPFSFDNVVLCDRYYHEIG